MFHPSYELDTRFQVYGKQVFVIVNFSVWEVAVCGNLFIFTYCIFPKEDLRALELRNHFGLYRRMLLTVVSLALLWSCPGISTQQTTAAPTRMRVTETTTVPPKQMDVTVPELVEPFSTSLDSLEDALAVLNNLTSSQKLMWEQQQRREEEMKRKNQAELDMEAERTKTMQKEYKLLQDLKGKVNRKLKAMSKPNLPSTNGQDGTSANLIRPRDCADIYLDAEETSGVYRIWPTWDTEGKGYLVYCDMDTDGGGWTVIRRWVNSGFSNSFYTKTWSEYKRGFGDIHYDFWLGNELTYILTNQAAYEVRFDVFSVNGSVSTTYRKFWIEGEVNKYQAHAEEMLNSSTAGDLFGVHNNAPFSASDKNNLEQLRNGYNYQQNAPCSTGWWFKTNCTMSPYLDPMVSGSDKRDMKIRPAVFTQLKENSSSP